MAFLVSQETVDPSRIMTSFGDRTTAVVIGASGGIGSAITHQLSQSPNVARVLALSRRPTKQNEKLASGPIDLEDEKSIQVAANLAKKVLGEVNLVFVATGVLHDRTMKPEKALRSIDAVNIIHALNINAVGPALIAKHFTPLMPKNAKSVFAALSARVGSITENSLGGWYSYRASKAALNQLIQTTAIEIARKNGNIKVKIKMKIER